jgi:hypothetical protein
MATIEFTSPSVNTLNATPVAKLRLPHPYLTAYNILPSHIPSSNACFLQVRKCQDVNDDTPQLFLPLHNDNLCFSITPTTEDTLPPISDNTPWARSQRAPSVTFNWISNRPPSVGQIWLITYAILIIQPDLEIFRAQLSGSGHERLRSELKASTLAYEHPSPLDSQSEFSHDEIIVSRSAFWQGAGSPFGARSPWTPSSRKTINVEATDYTITTGFPNSHVHQLHPRRAQKPSPGSVVYSRYIPSLDEHFSLIVLDHRNENHVRLFHTWQNDPRVAKGWNETGTLEEHRKYLKKQYEDPHTLPLLGRFNDVCFSYFEIYWAKEDNVGAYYDADDYDRGRYSLVGDARYRGRHRVLSWWSCIIHYIFLDNHRTKFVIGEPVATNNTVLVYDYSHGLHVEKYIDFPHKRAVLVKVSRERFFQLCPLNQGGGYIAGTGVSLPGTPAKL